VEDLPNSIAFRAKQATDRRSRPSRFSQLSAGKSDAFVAKLDLDGKPLWMKRIVLPIGSEPSWLCRQPDPHRTASSPGGHQGSRSA